MSPAQPGRRDLLRAATSLALWASHADVDAAPGTGRSDVNRLGGASPR